MRRQLTTTAWLVDAKPCPSVHLPCACGDEELHATGLSGTRPRLAFQIEIACHRERSCRVKLRGPRHRSMPSADARHRWSTNDFCAIRRRGEIAGTHDLECGSLQHAREFDRGWHQLEMAGRRSAERVRQDRIVVRDGRRRSQGNVGGDDHLDYAGPLVRSDVDPYRCHARPSHASAACKTFGPKIVVYAASPQTCSVPSHAHRRCGVRGHQIDRHARGSFMALSPGRRFARRSMRAAGLEPELRIRLPNVRDTPRRAMLDVENSRASTSLASRAVVSLHGRPECASVRFGAAGTVHATETDARGGDPSASRRSA